MVHYKKLRRTSDSQLVTFKIEQRDWYKCDAAVFLLLSIEHCKVFILQLSPVPSNELL